jgi:FSR family fosmidomycin resistance protein-like MFS transporter
MPDSSASSATLPKASSGVAVALGVAVAHGATDLYQAFLHPLLPRLMDKLGLSVSLAATAAVALSLAGSLLQPPMGYLADRYGREWFVIGGPLVSAIFLSSMGLADSFSWLLVLLVLGGIGSSIFHPPAASLAVRLEAGKGSGFRYSVFSFGGTVGYTLGPLIAVGIVTFRGLEGLWIAMIPGLLISLWLLRSLPRSERPPSPRKPPSARRLVKMLAGPLGLVFGISALSAFVQRVFLTLEPIIAAQAGVSEAMGAAALSIYLGGQSIGTLVGGLLADRVDRRGLLMAITLLSVPAHLLALWLPPGSIVALGCAAASGFLNMALLPPVVVMAQEMIPEGAAASSGIVMGLAWAAGSLAMIGTGILGDVVGAQAAALLSVPALWVGTLLAAHPALRSHARPARAL